jgi:hypothetical protein
MSDPNSVLSAWQLTLMITVPVVLLFGWLIAVFIAAREPRARDVAAASGPAGTGTGTGREDASGQDAAGQDEPVRVDRRLAA